MGKIVVVIDIGSMWMGFVYFLKDDWRRVLCLVVEEFMLYKVLICILLQKDFLIFWIGYEVEDKYVELILKDIYYDYFFFKRF